MLIAFLLIPQASVRLRYLPPIGQEIRYSVKTTLLTTGIASQKDKTANTTSQVSLTATSRNGDITTCKELVINGQNGKSTIGVLKSTSTKKIDTLGRLISVAVGTNPEKPGSNFNKGVLFPDRAVKLRDSWSKQVSLNTVLGKKFTENVPETIRAKYALVGLTNSTASISYSMVGDCKSAFLGRSKPGAPKRTLASHLNYSGVFVVKRSDGTVISTSMKITIVSTEMGYRFVNKGSLELTRL
ncbi:hypothetical protein BH11ARM1_BH11ARM1_14160 [soil metagenome]